MRLRDHLSKPIFLSIWVGKPFKYLAYGIIKTGGRNKSGQLCSFKQGGGVKRKYRIIDFYRNLCDISSMVMRIEYDPNRTAYIALICYKNGVISYIIAVEKLQLHSIIVNYSKFSSTNYMNFLKLDIKSCIGFSLNLGDIPIGSLINNIEMKPGSGASLCRAAGACALILNKLFILDKTYVTIRLPSGVEHLLLDSCRAVIGIVSNIQHFKNIYGLAGFCRRKGIRPTVRGVAMNPVDHPHGGGEGRKSSPVCARSPWGKLSKGIKTRKKISNKFILKKHNG